MGLREDILTDPVSSLEMRTAITVSGEEPVRQVAKRMRQSHMGCAIVVDAHGKPVGKFTERLYAKLMAVDPALAADPVAKHMYHDADVISQDASVTEMVSMMQAKSLRYICVVDGDGKVKGITGQKGLMRYISEYFPRVVMVQRMRPLVGMDQPEGA